jgi:polyhydroxyalkanoate synthase subunit PhaC
MPPELPGTSVLDAVRKEVARSAVRARNGVKWAAGAEFAPPHPTPSDEIWRDGKVHVRHYRRDTPPRLGPPVVAFLGLVGQSYVFDLYKGGSIVQMLIDRGFDSFVLDWGGADGQDAENTLETYLQGYLPRALEAVCQESGWDEVNIIGYCMGGVMIVQALAAQPALPVRSVVTIASPFDWTRLDPTVDALREGKVKPDDVLDATGNVPASVVLQSFKRRKPTSSLVNYANLWQNLWNDHYVEGYQAIGRFLHDQVPLSGGVFRQIVQQWIIDNGFVNDTLRLGGRRAELSNVRCPVLAVVAERDDIAPPDATTPIVDLLPNAPAELLKVDAGHVSLFAGREAVKVLMPMIFDWIEARSEEAE